MRYFFITLFVVLTWVPVHAEEGPPPNNPPASEAPELPRSTVDTGTATHYLHLATMYQDTSPVGSLPLLMKTLDRTIREKNLENKAKAFFLLGEYYHRRRFYLRSQQQFLSARNNYLLARDTIGAIRATRNLGFINQYLNHFDPAEKFFSDALQMATRKKDLIWQGQLIFDLAVVDKLQGDTLSSDSLFKTALTIFRKAHNINMELNVLTEQGNSLIDQKKYDEALVFYNKLLVEAEKSSVLISATISTKIAHIYEQKKIYRKSLNYNLKAFFIRQAINSVDGMTSSYMNIAGDYFNLGKGDSAMCFLEKGMELANKYNRLDFIVNGYQHLYTYYERIGDYKSAHENYSKYSALHEQLLVERNKNHIKIVETQRALEQKIESGNQLRKQNKIQALILNGQQFTFVLVRVLAIIAGIVAIIVGAVFVYNQRSKNRLMAIKANLTREIYDREIKEQQTRNTERKFRILSENSIDFVSLSDENFQGIYASPSCLSMFGYEPEVMLKKTVFDLIHPDYQDLVRNKIKEMIETRKSTKFTAQSIKQDGTVFWVESSGNPMFDPITGNFKGLVALTRDIHERKVKEFEIMEGTTQKENLLKEIHHRVKNNFAILVSLINMQIAQSKDPGLAKSLTNLQLRIRSMALVHEMLYRSKDFEKISFPDYIRSLATVISGTFNRRDIIVNIEAEEAVLNIDSSIPLGLIVNELIANSFTHAFPDGKSGEISVRFSNTPDSKYSLIIRDNGTGLPTGFSIDNVNTMGLQIVQLLCKQIEADLTIVNDNGASFAISFQQQNS